MAGQECDSSMTKTDSPLLLGDSMKKKKKNQFSGWILDSVKRRKFSYRCVFDYVFELHKWTF